MKKFKFLVAFILATALLLSASGCGLLDGYQGTYECYYYSLDGQTIDVDTLYEYYTITLDGLGNLRAKFKLKNPPYTSGDALSKYEIKGDKLIETVEGLKNEYGLVNNEIIVEMTLQGKIIIAKFKLAD